MCFRKEARSLYTYTFAQLTLSRDVFQEGPDNIYVRVSLQSCAHCPEMCFCLYFYRIGSLQGDEKVGDKRLKFVELFF